MSDTIATIRKITNGFIICANDPAIQKANKDPKKPYRNSSVEYTFDTFEKVLKWLKEQKDNLVPEPDSTAEYANSFDEATATEK